MERQAGDHFDGVPFYGPKSDISGPEISNRLAGSKRSNSDSFMGSSRDGVPQIGPESLESSHLMKILRNGTGGDRPRRSSDEELFLGMQSLRPTSASLILQPPTGSRTDVNLSKWDRSVTMNVNPTVQYPLRAGQFAPFLHQVPPNRFKDANSGNAGPSNLSQPAADEGSRTGIKGSGILSSITANASGSVSERNPSGLLPSGNRPKSRTHILEPESSTAPSRLGSTSSSRQMTIFYGGQAHVFDDVHPNKADVIMALAGSNGGSWSTTYSPKSTVKPVGESTPNGDNETGMAGNSMFPREFRGRLSLTGNPSQGYGSGDRILTLTGAPQGVNIPKDTRNPVKAAEPSTEEKRREV
ncbi:protein TIFY 8 isoform X3 [Vitis riparia]|uniref:protein TIFY 8 isoform X3 n=1 Tax=Vitis riparia TaxID=96939 RepID=UPI00155A2CD7|nr:protein TIFY 8 isoform X3 [Vitis riparia]